MNLPIDNRRKRVYTARNKSNALETYMNTNTHFRAAVLAAFVLGILSTSSLSWGGEVPVEVVNNIDKFAQSINSGELNKSYLPLLLLSCEERAWIHLL